MKILIATLGSRGDVQPYVALGKGLQTAGHTVTVCTSVRFERFITDHGLAYAYLSDDFIELLDTAEGRGALEDMGSFLSGVKTAVKLLRKTGPIQRAIIQDGWSAARKVAPDLILYNSKMGGAPHYADKLGIPAAMAVLFPQFVPTAAFPTIVLPRWKLGGWYNKLTYRVVLTIAGFIGSKYVKEWRAAHGLPSQKRGTDLLHRSDGALVPVLHGLSSHVVPEPADWPDSAVTTGYWFLNHSVDWEPSPALERFLSAGDPPVYVGFGSMAGRDPERVTRIVIDALQRAGLRGVLATGWGGLASAELPDFIFSLDQAPHDWLFPRVAAVVHHGGAGTTAAGLRAGRPTIICPFFGDQPFWGRRLHELVAGSEPIPQKKLTAEKLADALRIVTADPAIQKRAKDLGEKIRSEDGVANALAFIEQSVARKH